jgi:hypothetical protein
MDIEAATPLLPHTVGTAYLNGAKIRVTFDTGAASDRRTACRRKGGDQTRRRGCGAGRAGERAWQPMGRDMDRDISEPEDRR